MYQTILHDFDMRMLMDSGQVFRICCCGENTYAVASGRHLVRIRQTACGPSKEGTLSAFGMSGEGFLWSFPVPRRNLIPIGIIISIFPLIMGR